jgi:hypothetical protein
MFSNRARGRSVGAEGSKENKKRQWREAKCTPDMMATSDTTSRRTEQIVNGKRRLQRIQHVELGREKSLKIRDLEF